MKVLGLIAEYNPFHNGHLYHIEKAKEISGADYVICVMSGNFIQRGEPSIVNKWARTKAALLCCVDLVIELPVVYAMASAEYFAYGAVKILDSLGIVDFICFGSESGDISQLDLIAEALYKEPENFRTLLKESLGKGLSFPSARESALNSYFEMIRGYSSDIASLLGFSNNILGIEYLKALKKLQSKIIPLTIKRVQNSYNAEHITGSISSATSIRKNIFETLNINSNAELSEVLPKVCVSIIHDEFKSGRGPISSHNYENIILASVRGMSRPQIKALPYISEGLENRIKESGELSGSLDELIEKIKTKRYTKTRIQRILFNILTSLSSAELELFKTHGGPQYIRILGFNQNGPILLSQINKGATLPVIIKTADFKNSCNPLLKRMLEIEAFSTDMYVLGYKNPEYRKAGQEFTQNIVRI